MRKRVLAACLLPLLLVMAAGCSKADDGEGVASVGSSGPAPSPTSSLSVLEQGIKYAQCMRAEGLPWPDPEVDGDTVRLRGLDSSKGAVDADTLHKAEEACKQDRPVLNAPDMELKLEGALEYARCMRAHGVENFPDPDANGGFQLPQEQTDPDYDQARATCRQPRTQSPSPGATRR
ncbi:hypothetical protein [Actinopolymorpha alba]|uniref:hypothetical protein n=1 Tax=Actinopolymorpha alba TaxID=533267 RepID=UPI00039D972F|nr:hypothetical protein [Actinopolymorpha alba]